MLNAEKEAGVSRLKAVETKRDETHRAEQAQLQDAIAARVEKLKLEAAAREGSLKAEKEELEKQVACSSSSSLLSLQVLEGPCALS